MLRAGHVAMLEAAMLSSQRKHPSDLYLEDFPPAPSLDVFALFQSIMDDRFKLLYEVTTWKMCYNYMKCKWYYSIPKGMWVDKAESSNCHLPDLTVPADEGNYTGKQVPSCEVRGGPPTAVRTQRAA